MAIQTDSAPRLVRDVMTTPPVRLPARASVSEAARLMQRSNIGAVLVEETGTVIGILTDRDITLRVVAEARDPESTPIADVCSYSLYLLGPDDDLDRAIQVMRERAVRRLPVVDAEGHAVGVLSLGDVALARDSNSDLGCISNAPPNN